MSTAEADALILSQMTIREVAAAGRAAKEVERLRFDARAERERLDACEPFRPQPTGSLRARLDAFDALPNGENTPLVYGGEVARFDRGELQLTDPDAWKKGGCACACATRRNPTTGRLDSNPSACVCERTVDVSDDPDRGLKVTREPCDPNRSYPATTINGRPALDTMHTDATDEITKARAKRDQLARDAWKTRTDAVGGDPDAEASAWSKRLGVPITREDIEGVIRDVRGGDANLSDVDPDGMRRMVRAARDARAAAKATTAPAVRTDANEDPVTAARRRRDEAYANAWKTGGGR